MRKLYEGLRRAGGHGYRHLASHLGPWILPPWRCPGCGAWSRRRRLAVCHGGVSRSAWRARTFAAGCLRCGLLYTVPQPPASDTSQLYSADGDWATAHAAGRDAPRISRKLADAVDRIAGITRPAPGGAALDFGCGVGRWLNTLAECGWQTYGIELSNKEAFARHTELRDIPATPRFDFVVASHVLEHLRDPGAVLGHLGRATRAHGWIFVSVPSLDRLPEHRDWKYVLNTRAHLTAYSLDCLRTLLARAGYGGCVVVTLPDDAGKSAQRLRVLARKGAARDLPAAPLESAVRSLREAGITL